LGVGYRAHPCGGSRLAHNELVVRRWPIFAAREQLSSPEVKIAALATGPSSISMASVRSCSMLVFRDIRYNSKLHRKATGSGRAERRNEKHANPASIDPREVAPLHRNAWRACNVAS